MLSKTNFPGHIGVGNGTSIKRSRAGQRENEIWLAGTSLVTSTCVFPLFYHLLFKDSGPGRYSITWRKFCFYYTLLYKPCFLAEDQFCTNAHTSAMLSNLDARGRPSTRVTARRARRDGADTLRRMRTTGRATRQTCLWWNSWVWENNVKQRHQHRRKIRAQRTQQITPIMVLTPTLRSALVHNTPITGPSMMATSKCAETQTKTMGISKDSHTHGNEQKRFRKPKHEFTNLQYYGIPNLLYFEFHRKETLARQQNMPSGVRTHNPQNV